MAWSGEPCYPRISKTGLRHFVHYPGTDTGNLTWHETLEHLTLKDLVVQTAIELGWEARTEVPASDRSWIADTLLTKDGKTVAIEIQWSRQSNEDYRYRQERYEKAGIQCYWITRHHRSLSWKTRGNLIPVPRFQILNPNEILTEKPHVEVADNDLNFDDFLSKLLAGEIRLGQISQLQATSCEWCNNWNTRWSGIPDNFTAEDREMARQYKFPSFLQKRGYAFHCFTCDKRTIWALIDTNIKKPFALLEYWSDTNANGSYWGLAVEERLERYFSDDILKMHANQ